MSKSDASDNSRINLTDDADTIAQKVRKAKTDPEPLPSEEKGLENRPEADNLVGIYAALSERAKADVLQEFGGGQFSSFKNALVELCVAKRSLIASEMKRPAADPGHVDKILIDGADRARVIADETMRAARDIVGFIRKKARRKINPKIFIFTRVAPPDAACRKWLRRGSMRRFGAAPGYA